MALAKKERVRALLSRCHFLDYTALNGMRSDGLIKIWKDALVA
jgi:hypothetical protein